MRHSLWWSFFTLASGEPIGGEPITEAGRLITISIILGGLTVFAIFTGIFSALMMQKLKTVIEVRDLELDELRDHIVIGGWNRSGHLIVAELMAEPLMRRTPLVIVTELTESPETELRQMNHPQLYFYSDDYTTIEALDNVGIRYASRVILLADATRPRSDQDRDARTVLAALTIEKLNPDIYTCAQLLNRKNDTQLRVAGVEDIIVADELTSHLIATSVRNLGGVEALSEVITVQIGNQLYRVNLPRRWSGLSFTQVSQRLKQEYDSILVAVERNNHGLRRTLVNPPSETKLLEGEQLLIIARQLPPLN